MLIIGLLFILHKTAGNAKCQTEQRYFVVVAFSLLSEELAFSMMPHVCTNETTAAFAFPMFLFLFFPQSIRVTTRWRQAKTCQLMETVEVHWAVGSI